MYFKVKAERYLIIVLEISTENYLKVLFNLGEQDSKSVKTNAISEKLQISPAAVSEMLKKLAEKGYVTYAPYKGVSLTEKGLAIGKNMVRRHRILEMYLHKELGYSWDKVHEEAEQLEHAASDELIQKMEAVLNFPKFDPHGDPIPSIDGHVPKYADAIVLSNGKKGETYTVLRVSDLDAQFLDHLAGLGIRLGTTLLLKEILSFDHSFVIQVSDRTQAISYFTAQHIWVRKGIC